MTVLRGRWIGFARIDICDGRGVTGGIVEVWVDDLGG